jgi:hypothetical protein
MEGEKEGAARLDAIMKVDTMALLGTIRDIEIIQQSRLDTFFNTQL